ncbi:hypothetical protein HYQ46_007748 [Verticillium longisporum]|nr:hypothetical protein HYQ46_007748 [Verticillium longisporum]
MSSNPEKPPLSGQAPNQNQEPYYPTPAASGLPPAGFGQPTQSSQQPQQPQQMRPTSLRRLPALPLHTPTRA